MKQTVFAAEISTSETERQTSLVIKLSLVRICNSVLLIFLVSSYSDMLSLTLVNKISSLLILDIVLGPTLRLLDLYNLVMRYCVAKKAATQASMNTHFNGTYWNLAERYTDVTKTFFLCLFYSAISPSSYGLAFVAIGVNYFVDKYLLLQRWRVPPNFDATMSNANRYFQYLAILSHSCIALYFYRNWPFECSDAQLSAVGRSACESSLREPLISSTYSVPNADLLGSKNFGFYVAVLCLMIVCIIIIFYYFCCKVCIKTCDQCFNCIKDKIVVDNEVSISTKEFLDIEHPDWYYPRFHNMIEANSPQLMSDVFVQYYHDQLIADRKNHGPQAKWRWPAQLTYQEKGHHCDSMGVNAFQSSLMVEHKIFYRRDEEARTSTIVDGVHQHASAQGINLGFTNPNKTGTGQPRSAQGILASAF